jgi:outer membrane lipoprotein SlyB
VRQFTTISLPSPYPYGGTVPVASTGATTSTGSGVVQGIEVVPGQQSSGALGTVAGAVVGGLLGNQIGSGSGKTAATIAGAAGGGYVGNRVQQNSSAAAQAYRVTVRMDNGHMQTVMLDNPSGLQVGDRIQLQDGAIVQRLGAAQK